MHQNRPGPAGGTCSAPADPQTRLAGALPGDTEEEKGIRKWGARTQKGKEYRFTKQNDHFSTV